MSGPPYPRPPIPFDYWSTILSQYANSSVLTKLIGNFSKYLDIGSDMDQFYDLIWNIDTAQGYGLDVWGRIVGVTRILTLTAGTYLGFTDSSGGASGTAFDVSPLFGGTPSTSNYALADADFRVLIFAKALSNISDGSIPAINQILINLFPTLGNSYVTDGLDMTMTYTFSEDLTPIQLAIVQQTGVLPKPVGVSVTIVEP